MAQVFRLAFVFLICCSNPIKEKSGEISNLTFICIGERQGVAYFREVESNDLYKLGTKKQITLFKVGKADIEPRLVNENGIIYTRSDNRSILIEFSKGQTREINLSCEIEEICSDDELKHLYVQVKYTAQIGFVNLLTGELKLTTLSGSNLKIIKNMLYFTQKSIDGEGYVNLYRTHNFNDKELLLENTFEDGLYIFPSGNFLVCQIPVDGQPTKAIYSFADERFSLIKDEEIQRGNYYSYFDERTRTIVFYRPRGYLTQEITLPTNFEFMLK